MKRCLLVYGLLFCLWSSSYAQSIQYSKGTFYTNDPNNAQLVSNIEGYHHLISFSFNKKPVINIFDDRLRLLGQKQLDYWIRKDCDVKILSFPAYYYIALHIFKPSYYEIWKVDKLGNSVKLSANLQAVIDTSLRLNTSTLQLLKVEGNLYALAQTYFDSLKSIRCKVVQLDTSMATVKKSVFLYPFDSETEFLQQTSLGKDALLVLKSAKDEFGNALHIMSVDLASGDVVTTSFNTGFQVNVNPGFITSDKDSSVLVYSTLMQTTANRSVQRSVFMSRLDHQLKELTPVTLLKRQFTSNTFANFVCVQGEPCLWLNISGNRRPPGSNLPTFRSMQIPMGAGAPPTVYNYVPNYNYRGPTGVRFTLLDKQFKRTSDSLVANDKRIIEVQSSPFGQFAMDDKAYLLLTQNYTAKRKGLVMLSSDKGKLSVTALPVFDRYDYMLSQLQYVNRNFIVPYSFKNEMGLMKVTVKEDSF